MQTTTIVIFTPTMKLAKIGAREYYCQISAIRLSRNLEKQVNNNFWELVDTAFLTYKQIY